MDPPRWAVRRHHVSRVGRAQFRQWRAKRNFARSAARTSLCVVRAVGDTHDNRMRAANKTNFWPKRDRARFNYRRYGVLNLVGGGVGITPIIGLVKDIYLGDGARPHSMAAVYVAPPPPHPHTLQHIPPPTPPPPPAPALTVWSSLRSPPCQC